MAKAKISRSATAAPLTSTQEDYIETVFRLTRQSGAGVRITDLAVQLGCRLPTVTRTVRLLADLGYFDHESRGLVHLSGRGRTIAEEIVHRHDDVVSFLQLVLGLPSAVAESDACQIEHGLSPLAAERLHVFLNYVESMPLEERKRMQKAVLAAALRTEQFRNLIEVKAQGWRR